MRFLLLIFLIAATAITNLNAQKRERLSKETLDSLYLAEVEEKRDPVKVLHAEPLYIDLIRDLGARKGEKEWNVGLGLTDNNRYDEYTALVEYEWAVVDRLGLEVELPFSFYYPVPGNGDVPRDSIPRSRLNSLKLAAQWSFFVSEKLKTSMALGYLHEFELVDFTQYRSSSLVRGNVYNPFFVAAKRWGDNFHTLLYTGPLVEHHFRENTLHTTWQVNTNLHYMIPGTRNFIGVEFNKEFGKGDFDMIIRPQMRVSLADNLMIGIVTGIPVARENQRFSSFLRLIYEPGHPH
jgi:hypothetical protein